MKPICIPCQRFFRQIKTGEYFVEGMPTTATPGVRVEPGTSEPENWKPYKIWSGDRWQCQGCGAEIISGVGRSPVAEHYQPEFEDVRVRLGAKYQVNDC